MRPELHKASEKLAYCVRGIARRPMQLERSARGRAIGDEDRKDKQKAEILRNINKTDKPLVILIRKKKKNKEKI